MLTNGSATSYHITTQDILADSGSVVGDNVGNNPFGVAYQNSMKIGHLLIVVYVRRCRSH